ncbi:hypothetical protein LY76DRAFT_687934 [Colletotrichum caudatum]|nr:hypothetical protein LY76DRAFT_687934 [Colletotrichum caudatum]
MTGGIHSKRSSFTRDALLSKSGVTAAFEGFRDTEKPLLHSLSSSQRYRSHWASTLKAVKDPLGNFHRTLLSSAPGASGTDPGFADPEIRDAQCSYLKANLVTLSESKGVWDSGEYLQQPSRRCFKRLMQYNMTV